MWLNYHLDAPDVLLTALKAIATLETSLEANYDRRADTRQTKRLIGARATALPKNKDGLVSSHILSSCGTVRRGGRAGSY